MRTTTRSIIFVTLVTGKGIRRPVFIFKTCCHLYMNLCFLILNNLLEEERENRVENCEHLVRSRCPRVVRSDHGADGDALLKDLRMMRARIKTPSLVNNKNTFYTATILYKSSYTHRQGKTMISLEWSKIKNLYLDADCLSFAAVAKVQGRDWAFHPDQDHRHKPTMIMTNNLYWSQLQNLAGIFILTNMIIFIFDGEIIDNNKRALNALLNLRVLTWQAPLHEGGPETVGQD